MGAAVAVMQRGLERPWWLARGRGRLVRNVLPALRPTQRAARAVCVPHPAYNACSRRSHLQVNNDGVFRFAAVPWFSQALQLLVASGTYGVALDVWVRMPGKAPCAEQLLLRRSMCARQLHRCLKHPGPVLLLRVGTCTCTCRCVRCVRVATTEHCRAGLAAASCTSCSGGQ